VLFRSNGLSRLCITKLDVLDGLADLQLCTGYQLDGAVTAILPDSAEAAANADGSARKVNAAAPPATSKVSTATSRTTLRRARRGFALGVVRAPVAALLAISPHLPQISTMLQPLGTKPPSSTGYLGVAHTSLFGVLHPFSINGVSRCHFATLRPLGNSCLTRLAGAVTAWKVW
jgi:hypothetical protein